MLVQICSVHHAGLVLTADGTENGDKVHLKLDYNGPNQIWKMEKDGDWCVFKSSQTVDQCLDFDKDSHCAQVWDHKFFNTSNQQWKVVGEHIMSKYDQDVGYVLTSA